MLLVNIKYFFIVNITFYIFLWLKKIIVECEKNVIFAS